MRLPYPFPSDRSFADNFLEMPLGCNKRDYYEVCSRAASCEMCISLRIPWEQPDPHQTGVRWVALDDLPHIPLLPHISERLIAALQGTGQADPLIEQI